MKASRRWLENLIKEQAEKDKLFLQDPLQKEAVEDDAERQGHQARITQVYEVQATLVIKDTVKIDDVYTEIRAIEGVTVVSTAIEKAGLGMSREKSLIKIKFLKGRNSLKHYVSLLTRSILRVNGVVNVKLLTARKLTA